MNALCRYNPKFVGRHKVRSTFLRLLGITILLSLLTCSVFALSDSRDGTSSNINQIANSSPVKEIQNAPPVVVELPNDLNPQPDNSTLVSPGETCGTGSLSCNVSVNESENFTITQTTSTPTTLPTEYAGAGTGILSYNTTNAIGSTITPRIQHITVNVPAPVANFISDKTSGTAPLTVAFTDTSTNSPTSWAWYFGDGYCTAPWLRVNASAGWSARSYSSSVVMPDGSILLMGGGYVNDGFKNDTWRSTNNGQTWTLQNTSSGWSARAGHSSIVMPDGSVILMGGYDGLYTNDTWRSIDNGKTWTLLNASAGWTVRSRHSSVVMPDGSIVLMGGRDGSSYYKNDVWRSKDNGTTWIQMTAHAWYEGRFGHSSVVIPNGSIILMGGEAWNVPYNNDAWRSTDNGATWTMIRGSIWSSARVGHTSVVMQDGSIIMTGGQDGFSSYKKDVWQSTDKGATWTAVNASPDWSARAGHMSVVMPDGTLELMGGHDLVNGVYKYNNDVWRLMPAGSSLKNPTHTYTLPGNYTVSLLAYSTDGYNITQKSEYITIKGFSESAPVANFTTKTPLVGPAPLSVTFTDLSVNLPTGWAWYFGDENFTVPWTLVNASVGWSGRDSHTSVVMPDGSIVLMGGYSNSHYLNDVWRSRDKGKTWTQVTAIAGWQGREGHASVVMPDGSIVLEGGFYWDDSFNGANYKNDVWRSTDNGKIWSLVSGYAPWAKRSKHSSVAMPDGSIVLMGGKDPTDSWYPYKDDVWRSTNYGASWTQKTNSAEWLSREGHSSVAMPDGSIVLMGGSHGGNYENETWRSTNNGATWTLMNGSSGWLARDGHTSVTMPDGSIVLMGGFNGGLKNDTWRSTDNGQTWTLLNISSGWSARNKHTCVVLPDGSIVLMGGYNYYATYKNDVWHLVPAGSSQQNPVHTYTVPGNYSVTLQAYNARGFNSTQKIRYINVLGSLSTPVANFSATPTTGTSPLTVKFTDTSTNSPIKWNWTFGDGSRVNASMQNPIHTYAAAGTYTVSLNATNAGGSNTSFKTNYITVYVPAPVANFTLNVTSGLLPRTIQFTDTSTGIPTSWNWSFGDGTNTTVQNPVHTYRLAGNHTITLTATNAGGSNMIVRERFIIIYPKGDFNHNWKVDAGDAALVAYMVIGRAPVQIPDADFNNNGFVDIGDAAKIAYFVVKKIPDL
ncbi:MAG: PKD domain-containing protein [Methanoregula sp.]|nr:PKD domain-containing protein [Methanoregula sp.]